MSFKNSSKMYKNVATIKLVVTLVLCCGTQSAILNSVMLVDDVLLNSMRAEQTFLLEQFAKIWKRLFWQHFVSQKPNDKAIMHRHI